MAATSTTPVTDGAWVGAVPRGKASLLPLSLLSALLLLQADAPRSAEQLCRLTSTQLVGAEVRLSPPDGAHGQWKGALHWGRQELLPISLGSLQGYGSRVWGIPSSSARGELAIPFAGGQPARSLGRAVRFDAYLFAGLGATLYYSGNRTSEVDLRLVRAAEGFWQVGDGCRDRVLFGLDPAP